MHHHSPLVEGERHAANEEPPFRREKKIRSPSDVCVAMRLCVPTAHVLDSTQTAHEGLDEEQGHDRRAKIAMSAAMPEEAMTHGYQFQAMAKLVTKRQIGNSNIRLVPEA